MPFFSVIIPTFNRAALLHDALTSVFAQQFADFEVLVVDDGSTDDTEIVARSFGPAVKFLKQANAGPGAARNLGISEASGRYITFLDSDDKWFPWTLNVFRQAILSEESPSFLAGFGAESSDYSPNQSEEKIPMSPELIRYPSMLNACTGRTPPVGGTPSICVERLVLLNAGGFVTDRINGEDTDLWLRLGDKPGFVRILTPPVFWQRLHDDSVTRQLAPAVAGAWHLLNREKKRIYPGGALYRRSRRRIICGTVRSVSRECLTHGKLGEAFRLYSATFAWNFLLGNFKYLAGFPMHAIFLGR